MTIRIFTILVSIIIIEYISLHPLLVRLTHTKRDPNEPPHISKPFHETVGSPRLASVSPEVALA